MFRKLEFGLGDFWATVVNCASFKYLMAAEF
jgi:hypothetical protein